MLASYFREQDDQPRGHQLRLLYLEARVGFGDMRHRSDLDAATCWLGDLWPVTTPLWTSVLGADRGDQVPRLLRVTLTFSQAPLSYLCHLKAVLQSCVRHWQPVSTPRLYHALLDTCF